MTCPSQSWNSSASPQALPGCYAVRCSNCTPSLMLIPISIISLDLYGAVLGLPAHGPEGTPTDGSCSPLSQQDLRCGPFGLGSRAVPREASSLRGRLGTNSSPGVGVGGSRRAQGGGASPRSAGASAAPPGPAAACRGPPSAPGTNALAFAHLERSTHVPPSLQAQKPFLRGPLALKQAEVPGIPGAKPALREDSARGAEKPWACSCTGPRGRALP